MPTDPETRAKGDHLLVDERAIGRIVASANLRAGESVLDVGAGEGALTRPCALAVGTGGRVVAIEQDPARCWTLRGLGLVGLEVVEGDALAVDLPRCDAVVANPPFRIAVPLLRRLLDAGFGRAVLVLPDELAQRLAAQPGDPAYGKLSVEVGVRAKAAVLGHVSRHAFDPPPDVASAVVRLAPRPGASLPPLLEEVLEAAWSQRERTLRHSLAPLAEQLGLPPQDVTEAVDLVNGRDRRFADVTPWEFATIAAHLDRCRAARRGES